MSLLALPAPVLRSHEGGGVRATASYSDCETYRYSLTRRWGDGPILLVVMLNPSTATETRNDPTIARCETRARSAGFAALEVVNLFAFRATRPADLRRAADPVGPQNDAQILESSARAARILCAWGIHGAFRGRGAEVGSRLAATVGALWHLGLTRDGAPRHPLYLPGDRAMQRWTGCDHGGTAAVSTGS